MRRLLNPRHILPLMIFFGVLMLGLRLGDAWQTASSGVLLQSAPAHAAESKTETKAEAAPAPAPAPSPPAADVAKPAVDGGTAPIPAEALAATDDSAEMDVLKQLAERRAQLDKRAHDLDTREALLKVAEQRVDQNIKEMETLRIQLQGMVNQISGSQQAQLDNLVKIYETMKPQDAAKIFESLDMPILLGVIQRMKPKSTAPIMAAMAPDKAKELTVALTKQDQLPQVK